MKSLDTVGCFTTWKGKDIVTFLHTTICMATRWVHVPLQTITDKNVMEYDMKIIYGPGSCNYNATSHSWSTED